MGLFNNKLGGVADVIRCDEPSYLIWKWHPANSTLGKSSRENSIRWNSSLRVKDGEAAIFLYSQKDGCHFDYIVGPYDATLKTYNFPVLSSILETIFDGSSPFQAEVYFINLARIIQIPFGIPYFDVFDPRYTDFSIPVAVRGTISISIKNVEDFIKLHRLQNFTLDDFQRQVRDAVTRYIKDTVSNAPAANNIPVTQLETKIDLINDVVEYNIGERLSEDFGVVLSSLDISAIDIDKTSDDYRRLMSVTKDVTAKAVGAGIDAIVKDIADKQAIDAEDYAENLRIQREERQFAMRKDTQSNYMEAFKTEKQAEVGIAGAESLGRMGRGSVSNGFNPADMMVGMTMGNVIGRNIAESVNTVLTGLNNPKEVATTPPPFPSSVYYIVINGKREGPFDMDILKEKAFNGEFSKGTLVWKTGMNEWTAAESIAELNEIFREVPPPIPS